MGDGAIAKDLSVITRLIRESAHKLFKQSKYSASDLFSRRSEIAKANLVIHLASSFIANRYLVWAEVPFKNRHSKRSNRFDLSIEFGYDNAENSMCLKIEAKRIAQGEEDRKIQEVIDDFERIKSWRDPLYLFRKIERLYGAIVIIFPEKCGKDGSISSPSLSEWWSTPQSAAPLPYSKEALSRLRAILEGGAKAKGVVLAGPPWNGGSRLAVSYAVFDFGSRSANDLAEGKKTKLYALIIRYATKSGGTWRSSFAPSQTYATQKDAEAAMSRMDFSELAGKHKLQEGEKLAEITLELHVETVRGDKRLRMLRYVPKDM
ncbi:MAG TPA: hypothetical protein VEI54_03305 [Candidatus Limnocylindrales bacterium]|nr:hypothetical protein [Candidatus Limnocylindrales bacterium]